MKITPTAAGGLTVGAVQAGEPAQTMAQRVRFLKMSTNATPGKVIEDPTAPIEAPALSNPAPTSDVVEPVTEETKPLSPQFAALARQKRALQQERQALDREKAEIAQAKTGGVDLARLKSDPLGVLLENGVGYDQLTEAVLANQNGYNPEIAALKAELAALKGEVKDTFTEKEAQAEQAALAEMRREASSLIAQGDDFELVRETGSLPDVMKLIERTYREHGEVLDVREALSLVEEELIKDSLKLANLKKVQSKFAPALPVPQPQQQQRQMRTLTNRDNASVPMSRRARALVAFAGELKR